MGDSLRSPSQIVRWSAKIPMERLNRKRRMSMLLWSVTVGG